MNERGFVMVMSLVVVGVLLALGLALTHGAASEVRLSRNLRDGTAALFIAEAGLERALVELRADPAWREGLSPTSFAGGEYQVEVAESETDRSVVVTATGTLREAVRMIEVTLRPILPEALTHAVYPRNDLTINGNMTINGSMLIDGDLILDGNLTLNGTLYLTGQVQMTGNKLSGDYTIVENVDPDLLPEHPWQETEWYLDVPHLHLTGNVVASQSDLDSWSGNLVVVDGNLTIGAAASRFTVTGETTIVSTGNMTVRADLLYSDRGPEGDVLMLVAVGDITFRRGEQEIDALIYSYQTVYAETPKHVFGGLVGSVVSVQAGLVLDIDSRLLYRIPPGTEGLSLKVTSWKQIP